MFNINIIIRIYEPVLFFFQKVSFSQAIGVAKYNIKRLFIWTIPIFVDTGNRPVGEVPVSSILFVIYILMPNVCMRLIMKTSCRKKIKVFCKNSVLIINDIQSLPMEILSANLFFQFIAKRYEKSTIMFTSKKLIHNGMQSFRMLQSQPLFWVACFITAMSSISKLTATG